VTKLADDALMRALRHVPMTEAQSRTAVEC
jgi:hypothetical protein